MIVDNALDIRKSITRRLPSLGGIMCFVTAALAWSQEATLPVTFGTAVLCLDDLAPGYFYDAMRQRPYKTGNGAYWFKTAEQLFGAPLTEIFISDGSSRYDFVGAVSSLPPVELAAVISANAPAGGGFNRLSRTDRYSVFVSRLGSEIAYQGKKGKFSAAATGSASRIDVARLRLSPAAWC